MERVCWLSEQRRLRRKEFRMTAKFLAFVSKNIVVLPIADIIGEEGSKFRVRLIQFVLPVEH